MSAAHRVEGGAPSGQRLRRPLFARLFGTVTSSILTIYALASAALVVLVVVSAGGSGNFSWWLLVLLVIDLLWLRVVTAWSSFDEDGVHTRYFVRFDYPWTTMRSITLQRLGNVASERTPGPPAIIVRMGKPSENEDKLVPALRCGRHRREFATALIAAAHAHGVRTAVGSSGWDEAQNKNAEFYE